MSRQEHLDWCKNRALEYINNGDAENTWASMVSDLSKHEDTAGHPAIELGMMLMFSGNMSGIAETKKFIEGFN